MEQADDFALGSGVETGGDFVAQQDFRIGDEFHGQAEAAFLAAGEDLHLAVVDRTEAGFFEHAVNPAIEFGKVAGADTQAGGGFDGFIDGEGIVSDGELGDVADFRGGEIPVLGEIAFIPEQGAAGLRIESRDGFQKSGLATTGRSDDSHEVAFRHADRYAINQRDFLAVFADDETDFLEF